MESVEEDSYAKSATMRGQVINQSLETDSSLPGHDGENSSQDEEEIL